MSKILQGLYNAVLRGRRLKRLTAILQAVLPEKGRILDLGCGNGGLSVALKARLPGLEITGVDPHPGPDPMLLAYDGVTIPFADNSFDHVMLITVLHHVDDYLTLLKEARRVCRTSIVLLDHQYANRLDWWTLALIDWPGNVPFGVYTPYNFKTRAEWLDYFRALNLKETYHTDSLHLFGHLDAVFGRNLHFLSILEKHGQIG